MTQSETEPEQVSTTLSDSPWWRSTPALLAFVALAIAGLVITILVLRGDDQDDAGSTSGALADAGALVAARQQALAFFSLDYRKAEANVDAVLALATGAFKQEYAASKDQVVAQVKEKKLVATATIPEGGVAVEFATPTQARILVVVDVDRTIGTQVDRLRNRSRILLERVDGRWLVSGVNQVG